MKFSFNIKFLLKILTAYYHVLEIYNKYNENKKKIWLPNELMNTKLWFNKNCDLIYMKNEKIIQRMSQDSY